MSASLYFVKSVDFGSTITIFSSVFARRKMAARTSFVSNPFGTLLYKASHDDEELHIHDLELAETDRYRTHWPFLRDRRIDSYQPITKRYIDED